MKYWSIAVLLTGLLAFGALAAEEQNKSSADKGEDALSLMTGTPAEGFELAVQLARRAVVAMQPNKEVLMDERPEYSEDAGDLIAASHVVAVHFQTVAAANDYWSESVAE